jgi:erythronate-4-phosphate dehydrogenase
MKIVADRAIPYIEHFFAGLGELQLLDGRAIDAAAVRDADILVVRSVTRVDAALLRGSRVAFAASATSGTNHVDAAYLAAQGIGFAAAAGCNARAVAEYVLSCLFVLAGENGREPDSRRVGIVGCGHVGGTLHQLLAACGIPALVCDPPLQESGARPDIDFVPLSALRQADIISLHVPLEHGGRHATAGMIDAAFLDGLHGDAVLINTARGEVLDEAALIRFLDAHPRAAAALDVWCNEPAINTELQRRARIGTAHIAGYSLDAKLRGTRMVYEQVCRYLDRPCDIQDPPLPRTDVPGLELREQANPLEAAGLAVLAGYDVRGDSAALARLPELEPGARADYFDGLRNDYPLRREFSAMSIDLYSCPEPVAATLSALGFRVEEHIEGGHEV